MGELIDNFGSTKDGQLIKSELWNGLVAALETALGDLGTRVETGFSEIGSRLDGFEQQVGGLEQRVAALEEQVEPLAEQYRLTLEAPRQRFAIGQLGEIVARVTDLRGRPLDLSDSSSRPWVDFVAAWGQLKPFPGSTSRGGAGDRAISVQVDGQGVARVRVRADHADGASEEAEEGMEVALKTRIEGKSVARILLDAETPLEASRTDAYKVIAREYDRPEGKDVRRYMDSYYLWRPPVLNDDLLRPPLNRWRDYRATVLAFVKNDADPTTADPSRGVASIQLTFRDWLGPFLTLDYFDRLDDRVTDIQRTLKEEFRADDLVSATFKVRTRLEETLSGQGLLGRQRDYQAARKALDQMTVDELPSFAPDLRDTIRDAMTLQQSLEVSQTTTAGITRQASLGVFSNAAVRADRETIGIRSEVNRIDTRFEELQESFQTVDHRVSDIGRSVETLDRKTQTVDTQAADLAARFTDVDSKVQRLTGLEASKVNFEIEKIPNVVERVLELERQIFNP